jgi:hypothetical protein
MKIYLAGGMPVMNTEGRERELCVKFKIWKRLFSFHYVELIFKSDILELSKMSKHENK